LEAAEADSTSSRGAPIGTAIFSMAHGCPS